jgi:hypothetical protein
MLTAPAVEILVDRCAELSSGGTAPGLLVPLTPSGNLATFLLDALRGAYYPYSGRGRGIKAFADGPLGHICDPVGLLALPDDELNQLKEEFAFLIKYVKRELVVPVLSAEGATVVPAPSPEALVTLAERLMRHLISGGWHPSHLHSYFTSDCWKLTLLGAADLAEALRLILDRFPCGAERKPFTVYTPRLIGRGGEDWGFISVNWNKLPGDVQSAFLTYIARELRIDPDIRTAQHDAAYQARYRKWELERETLNLSKYIRVEVPSRDPYSAAELFREQYCRMKSVLYISRKSTGPSSEKSSHYTHRNVGRSPVQLQDVSVIVDACAVERGANDAVVTAHLNAPAFPYQKLKNEFQRQRELLGFVFRQMRCVSPACNELWECARGVRQQGHRKYRSKSSRGDRTRVREGPLR